MVEVPSFRGGPDPGDRPHRRGGPGPRPRPHPVDAAAAARAAEGGLDRAQTARRLVEDLLAGAGLTQVINYSFGDDKWPELLRLAADDPRRQDGARRQPSEPGPGLHAHHACCPGCSRRPVKNVAVREERVHIFEVGKVFLPSDALLPRRTAAGRDPGGRALGRGLLAALGRRRRLLPGQRASSSGWPPGCIARSPSVVRAAPTPAPQL